MARWLEFLSTYDFSIQHRAGRSHGNADGLSRRPCGVCKHCDKRDELNKDTQPDIDDCSPVIRTMYNTRNKARSTSVTEYVDHYNETSSQFENDDGLTQSSALFKAKTNSQLLEAQLADHVISVVHKWKSENLRPPWEEISQMNNSIKTYWSQWNRLVLENGVLYRQWTRDNTGEQILHLVLPDSLRDMVLKMLHDDPTAGHLGVTRTMHRVRQRFYWVNNKRDVAKWCMECPECQIHNKQSCVKAPLKQYRVGNPMERVALDIFGPLPRTSTGKLYILVISDYYTRWTECYPMADIEAQTVAKLFASEFVCRFGTPREVHTDQGRQFESDLFQELCKILNIHKTRTTPYHPQSDGQVERFNRTLKTMLKKYVDANPKSWDKYLPFLLMAYRSSVHESTGETPSLMMLGREVELPIDLLYGNNSVNKSKEYDTASSYVHDLQKRFWNIHDLAREQMTRASERQKRKYDMRAQQLSYKIGDAVLLNIKNNSKLQSKFKPSWEGPYHVIAVLSDLIYQIKRGTNGVPKIVHHNLLKPFHERT